MNQSRCKRADPYQADCDNPDNEYRVCCKGAYVNDRDNQKKYGISAAVKNLSGSAFRSGFPRNKSVENIADSAERINKEKRKRKRLYE
jgi:hypothetical protein